MTDVLSLIIILIIVIPSDSSVGRVVDCRWLWLWSIGHWFISGSEDNNNIMRFLIYTAKILLNITFLNITKWWVLREFVQCRRPKFRIISSTHSSFIIYHQSSIFRLHFHLFISLFQFCLSSFTKKQCSSISPKILKESFEKASVHPTGEEDGKTLQPPSNSNSWRNRKSVFTNPGAIIGLDFAGAHDRVDRGFLYKAMVAFGFPSATIRWLQTLYETSEARVILNGTFGKPVVSEREIKQGFPLAMLLYIIYIGPLLLVFKK